MATVKVNQKEKCQVCSTFETYLEPPFLFDFETKTLKFRVQNNLFDATPTKVITRQTNVLIDKLCRKKRFKT
jgi:hypothetical protein